MVLNNYSQAFYALLRGNLGPNTLQDDSEFFNFYVRSKSGGGGGDPFPSFTDKKGKNNPINRQHIRKII